MTEQEKKIQKLMVDISEDFKKLRADGGFVIANKPLILLLLDKLILWIDFIEKIKNKEPEFVTPFEQSMLNIASKQEDLKKSIEELLLKL